MKKYLYEILVISLTIVLPIVSTIIVVSMMNGVSGQSPTTLILNLGMYTVFWGIGIRLFIAGVSQIFRPGFTSKTILGIKTSDADQVVRELGFANLSMGIVGILTLWFPEWAPAVAIIGGLFLGLDGIVHLLKKGRNFKENIAMVTDLFVAVVALTFAVVMMSMSV